MAELTDAPAEPLTAIVGLGASAGGMAALKRFFAAMPPQTGIAFVVVMHLDPDTPSRLPELLAALTGFTVTEASENEASEPNHVYIIPPGKNLLLQGGQLFRRWLRHASGQTEHRGHFPHSATALGASHCFHHVGHLPVLFQELVDILDLDAGACRDASLARCF